MKLEFNMAADVALVARPSQPTSTESPASSSAVTPSTPMRETGSCAPMRAQPMPSSTRCLARSRTEAGTSSSVVLATQVASRPVGPAGSVAGRAAATSVKCSYDTILIPGGPWRNPHTGQGLLTEYANLAPLCFASVARFEEIYVLRLDAGRRSRFLVLLEARNANHQTRALVRQAGERRRRLGHRPRRLDRRGRGLGWGGRGHDHPRAGVPAFCRWPRLA